VGANYVGLGYDTNVNIHHNKITNNGTVEANNGLAGGGGGLSICSGTDNYKVNYNFICGNFSQGDGGGLVTSDSARTVRSQQPDPVQPELQPELDDQRWRSGG